MSFLHLQSALFTHYPDYTGLTLAVLLEQELAMVESLKELLRLHDEMVSGIESMTAKIVKTEASRSANKFEQAAEQRIILEERQTSLTAFYKGFVYFSLPCSARFRAASLRRFSSFLSASQLTSSYALQVACLQFFTEIRYYEPILSLSCENILTRALHSRCVVVASSRPLRSRRPPVCSTCSR